MRRSKDRWRIARQGGGERRNTMRSGATLGYEEEEQV